MVLRGHEKQSERWRTTPGNPEQTRAGLGVQPLEDIVPLSQRPEGGENVSGTLSTDSRPGLRTSNPRSSGFPRHTGRPGAAICGACVPVLSLGLTYKAETDRSRIASITVSGISLHRLLIACLLPRMGADNAILMS